MIHSFDPEVAKDVGVEAAVLYQNIQYWCEKNRLNEQNYFDEQYWTYNTIRAFCEMFPYMTKGIIYRNLEKLEKKGYIATGNYNKSPYDRTKWYADIRYNIEPSSFQIQKMDSDVVENEFSASEQPIPNLNTNIKPDIKKESKKESKSTFDEILDSVEVIKENPELRQAFVDFIKMRKNIKKPLTDKALKLNINDAYRLGEGKPEAMLEIVNQSVKRSWAGMFPLKGPDTFAKKSGNKTGADAGIVYEGAKATPLENPKDDGKDFFEMFEEV